MIFASVVLPQPEGPVMATDSPAFDAKVHVLQHGRFMVGEAEADTPQLDRDICGWLDGERRFALGHGKRHVRNPLGVQAQHPELDTLLDQRIDARDELLLVRNEREQHADREPAVENRQCAQPDHGHVLGAEQCAVERPVEYLQALHAHAGVELIDQQVLISRSALLLPVEQLHALHAAHRLEKVGLLLGERHDVLFRRLAQRAI